MLVYLESSEAMYLEKIGQASESSFQGLKSKLQLQLTMSLDNLQFQLSLIYYLTSLVMSCSSISNIGWTLQGEIRMICSQYIRKPSRICQVAFTRIMKS